MESIALLVLLLGILTVLGIPKMKRRTPLPVTNATNNIEPYGDTYAKYYDVLSYDPERRAFQETLTDRFRDANSETLEIGCGLGHLVNHTGGTGLDKSAAMVQAASERYPSAHFVVGDAQNADLFPVERFTHIFCFGPPLFLMERKDLFFHSAKKWLEPGGILCITVRAHTAERSLVPSNLNYRATWTDRTHWQETFQHNGEKFKVKHMFFPETEETVLRMAKRAGLTLQEKVAFNQEIIAIFKAGI